MKMEQFHLSVRLIRTMDLQVSQHILQLNQILK